MIVVYENYDVPYQLQYNSFNINASVHFTTLAVKLLLSNNNL